MEAGSRMSSTDSGQVGKTAVKPAVLSSPQVGGCD